MSSTWEIEYRGQLADTASGGDKRTLAAWGLSGIPELTFANLARGGLSLLVDGTTSFLADLPWAYRDKIVVWRNGARYWHGWLIAVPRAAGPEADEIAMQFGDAWWLFESTTMTDPTITNAVTGSVTLESPNGSVTLTAITSVDWVEPSGTITLAWRDQSAWTVQGQIRRAFYAVTRGGASLALGSIGIDAPASGQETRSTTALAYIQAACQFEPLSVGWWDYSGATPALHVQPRSALTAASYALSATPLGFSCRALEELQALAVRIRWTYTASDGTDSLVTEKAGNDALPIGPNVLVLDSEVEDNDALSEVMHYHIADRLYAALHPLAYEGGVTLLDDISPLAAVLPGAALNITGGRTEWATMAAVIQAVKITVDAEAESLSCAWGAPRHLGLSDWMALRDLGNAGSDNARWDNSRPSGSDPQPGTFDDLNNNTPAPSPAGAIAIQTRGGTWTKCGYSSYNGAQPTRRWLVADTVHVDEWDCGSGTETRTYTAHGVYTPALPCGAPVVTSGPLGGALGGWGEQTSFCSAMAPLSRGVTSSSATAPVGVYTSIGQCCGTGYPMSITGGSEANTLSTEDTEEAAIARRMAVATWTDTNTAAIRTVPVTVASGIYDELRWGTYVGGTYTPITGLSPWHRYRAIGTIEIQPVDELGAATGDWYAAGETSAAWIASLSGTGGCEWQYIAPTAGHRTRITGMHVEEW